MSNTAPKLVSFVARAANWALLPWRRARERHLGALAQVAQVLRPLVASGLALMLVAVPTAWASAPAGEVICAQTQGFRDGDTFACVRPAHRGAGTVVVRVAGIDAPETGQAFSQAATRYLRSRAVSGTTVKCDRRDRHGRDVCRVYAPDGRDIAEEMVHHGLAWHATAHASEQLPHKRLAYSSAQARAQASKAGLWADSNPQPPWECRKLKRQGQRCR